LLSLNTEQIKILIIFSVSVVKGWADPKVHGARNLMKPESNEPIICASLAALV
jgi:hypothetical protein